MYLNTELLTTLAGGNVAAFDTYGLPLPASSPKKSFAGVFVAGWPFQFARVVRYHNSPSELIYIWRTVAISLASIILVHSSIIVIFQTWAQRFSIRTAMTGTALVAVLLAFAQTERFGAELTLLRYLKLIYCLPVPILVIAFCFRSARGVFARK